MPGLKDKIIPTDRAIIEQIEKQIGKKLKPWPMAEIIDLLKNGYALDKKGQVQGLNLDYREIKDISFLSGLGGLTHLSLRENQIKDLTPLKEFKNLKELNLINNQIKDLTTLRELKNLQRLDARNNRIEKLPPEILTWWPKLEIKWIGYHENGLNLWGNPLTDPPVEIVKQGTAAVKNYFAEMAEATVLFLESKLLLVGSGDVGKTTLMKKLKDHKFKVVPGKEDTTRGFDYWLNAVKLFGTGSPLIMVMNKADLRLKHIDEASFQDKYPNISRFLQVSCLSGYQIPELTETIRSAFSQMPHLLDKLPKRWMEIRDELKARPENYLSLDDYFDVCAGHRMEQEKALFLSDYLHDLGIILHFRHDAVLAGTVILKPEWATGAVYALIDSLEIQQNKGRFSRAALSKYWKAKLYPRHKHEQLLRLMEKFELCFKIAETDDYIIPELLPTQRPAGVNNEPYRSVENLQLQYSYDFMPAGIQENPISSITICCGAWRKKEWIPTAIKAWKLFPRVHY